MEIAENSAPNRVNGVIEKKSMWIPSVTRPRVVSNNDCNSR